MRKPPTLGRQRLREPFKNLANFLDAGAIRPAISDEELAANLLSDTEFDAIVERDKREADEAAARRFRRPTERLWMSSSADGRFRRHDGRSPAWAVTIAEPPITGGTSGSPDWSSDFCSTFVT